MPRFPRKPSPKKLRETYEEGFEGWLWNKTIAREWDQFWDGAPSFASAAPLVQGVSDKLKRVMLWRSREKYDPGAFGQESQTTGDCVSHGDRNARDVTRSVEIDVKGEPEEYYRRGATEPTYGARGHGGQGMDPTRAARFSTEVGWLVRKNYEGVADLTKYNSDLGAAWGRRDVPEAVKKLCREYNVGSSARPRTTQETKDLVASGYAGHSGQSYGCDAKLGPDGLCHKTKGWNHDMATVGYDWTLEIWSEPVWFVPNSWGSWNSRNPRWDEDALGPWIRGMLVVPAAEYERYFIKSGSIHFYSNVNGFPVKDLPNWGFDYV